MNSARRIGPFQTSQYEIRDIIKAWLAISLAFSFLISSPSIVGFLYAFLISFFTVGLGFLLHELAHKVVAQHYGCVAEFRAFNSMLVLAIALAFLFRIVFAAPGAVMISGPVGRTRNGIISMAGPLTNLILAAIFLVLFFLFPFILLQSFFGFGFLINTWLALFNMIPIWNLDGKKVIAWNKPVYWLMIAVCVVFFITGGLLGISF